MKHRCDIFAVAAKCGVRLPPMKTRYPGPLRPRDCFARATLRAIGQRHGEGILALTLRLIVETEGNSDQLYRETMLGISRCLMKHPSLLDRGTRLFDDFDRIDLSRVRRLAKTLAPRDPVEAVAVLIALRLLAGDEWTVVEAAA
jgi:hypothetical protein